MKRLNRNSIQDFINKLCSCREAAQCSVSCYRANKIKLVQSFIIVILRLQIIYHCVTSSSAWRWGFLSYSSFPVINKLRRLPATCVINSPRSVAAKRIALAAAAVHSMRRRQILAKNRDFCPPHLHSTPPLGGSRRNIAMPFGMEKLEWFDYPAVKKIWKYVYLF